MDFVCWVSVLHNGSKHWSTHQTVFFCQLLLWSGVEKHCSWGIKSLFDRKIVNEKPQVFYNSVFFSLPLQNRQMLWKPNVSHFNCWYLWIYCNVVWKLIQFEIKILTKLHYPFSFLCFTNCTWDQQIPCSRG